MLNEIFSVKRLIRSVYIKYLINIKTNRISYRL